MNLYTANVAYIRALQPEDRIVLGQEGRGRENVIIPVLPGEGEYYRAGATPNGVVVGRSQEFPGYYLVIVDSNGGYTRGVTYKARPVEGYPFPEVLAEGWGAWGDAGGIGSFQVALLKVRPGEAFALREKYGDHRIFLAGEEGIASYRQDEWAARKTLAAVEKGEIEWL